MQDDTDTRHLAYQKNNNINNSQYNSGHASNLRFMTANTNGGLFPQFGVPSHQHVETNGSHNYRLSPFAQNAQQNQHPLIMNGGLRSFKDTSSA
jgi:hypothetical protein